MEIFCCQKLRDTRDPWRGILAYIFLKISRAGKPHLPWVSIKNGTNSLAEAMTWLYFLSLDLALIAAAAPGK